MSFHLNFEGFPDANENTHFRLSLLQVDPLYKSIYK